MVKTMKNSRKTSLPVLRRFSVYHHVLLELKQQGIQTTSSTKLSEILEYKPIQIRKDIQLTGLVGKPKKGFSVVELESAIKKFLGWSTGYKAVLFGAGSLGTALLKYPWIEEYGLHFVAAFDKVQTRSNILINNIPVYHTDFFSTFIKKHKIEIAVIAVPAESAQHVADSLVENGIHGIWNFSYTHLRVPAYVTVENAQFTQSLAILTRRLIESQTSGLEIKE
jgi:redox-sensing transcriptional repressor